VQIFGREYSFGFHNGPETGQYAATITATERRSSTAFAGCTR
jgi:hypothetical protein